ncbi:MAG: RNA polymerase factor sigma-32 [Geminicoccaceae bacterium]
MIPDAATALGMSEAGTGLMGIMDTVDTQRANRRLIRDSMSAPLLTRDHELDLARKWRNSGDEKALHELIQAYMRLVISTASRFRNYGLPLGDLVQEGVVGLMQAAARFEPERDVRFSTYAAWWIRSAMQDYILRNWSVVRTGTTSAQKSLFFNLRRLRAKIDDGSYGHLDEAGKTFIANELKVEVSDVEHMEMRLMGGDQSLNAPISPAGEDVWQDFLTDERPSPEDVVSESRDSRTRAEWLASSIAELSPREQTIIKERRLREEGRTLEELGVRLGISKERVRQIEHRALQKLKAALLRRVKDPSETDLLTAVPV